MVIQINTDPTIVTMRFVAALYELMNRKDLDHHDVAQVLGVTVLDLVKMESGLLDVRRHQIKIAVQKLGISTVWITTGAGSKVRPLQVA